MFGRLNREEPNSIHTRRGVPYCYLISTQKVLIKEIIANSSSSRSSQEMIAGVPSHISIYNSLDSWCNALGGSLAVLTLGGISMKNRRANPNGIQL